MIEATSIQPVSYGSLAFTLAILAAIDRNDPVEAVNAENAALSAAGVEEEREDGS